jgi:hypothetical protein
MPGVLAIPQGYSLFWDPLSPTVITFELDSPYSAYPRTLTVWASIISSDYSLLSKILLCKLFIGRVLLQFYEIHPFDYPSINWWSLLNNHQIFLLPERILRF